MAIVVWASIALAVFALTIVLALAEDRSSIYYDMYKKDK